MAILSTLPTAQHMTQVHNKLLNKFSKEASKKSGYAKEIEMYLNEIKNGTGPEWNLIKDKVAKMANFRSAKNLFKHRGGMEFEIELTALLEALADYYFTGNDASKDKSLAEYTTTKTGKTYKSGITSTYHTGSITGTIKLTHDDFVNAPDAFLQMMMQGKGKSNDPVNDYIKAKEKQNWRSFIDLSARQIKSDVTGSKMGMNYLLEWTETDKLTRLLALLGSFNFSLKNYSSLGTMWDSIHIGNTNTFKAYAGVLGALGYSNDQIYNSFYRAVNCFQSVSINSSHQNHNASLHMGHIQSIYELIGMGLYYVDGSGLEVADNVDFLIINDYSSSKITVLSTDALAQSVLNEFNTKMNIGKRNYFGGGAITINGNKL